METIDLDRLSQSHQLELKVSSPESEAERRSRLAQAAHDRWKGTIAFGALILAAFGIGGIAAYLLLDSSTSPDDKKWAASVLTSLFAGAVAFVTGQKVGQASK